MGSNTSVTQRVAVSAASVAAPAATPRRRLPKEQRREQLLDVAAAVVHRGELHSLTMERLAELAGVSKALPYNHFDSIDHVLVALYRRESVRLGNFIWDRLSDAEAGSDLVRVHIAAYFDGINASGDLFGALTVPGSAVVGNTDPRHDGPSFSARVLHRFHGVDRARAALLGPIVNAAILGSGNAWRRKVATRSQLEDLTVHVVRSAVSWEGAPS